MFLHTSTQQLSLSVQSSKAQSNKGLVELLKRTRREIAQPESVREFLEVATCWVDRRGLPGVSTMGTTADLVFVFCIRVGLGGVGWVGWVGWG